MYILEEQVSGGSWYSVWTGSDGAEGAALLKKLQVAQPSVAFHLRYVPAPPTS